MELLLQCSVTIGLFRSNAEIAMVDSAMDRIVDTYAQMSNGSVQLSEFARTRLAAYLEMLIQGGQKDLHSLTVFGLTYLRELDGSNNPTKAGFTGL
jgi:hypothetical protein